MTKTQRQHRIGELIERERISTAAQLVTRLQSEGISATQATVTRDLQELGTIKVRDENGVRRIVPAAASTFTHAPLDHLRRMMGEWVVSVESSENLVVVRTPPGCAHVVASALDRSALDGVLGSVAGDDTVLVIAEERRGGMSLATEFRSLAGLDDVGARALVAGAIDCVLVDARDEMAEEFCAKAIAANARYENKYPLVSA